MMNNITFSQKGTSLVKVEENGSTGLALKMRLPLRYENHLQVHRVLGLASAFEQWTALHVQTQAEVDNSTTWSCFAHFDYHSSEPAAEKMKLDASPLVSVESRTGLVSHAE